MKVPLSWLSEVIDISGYTPQEIANMLTMAGLEVDDVLEQKPNFEKVVVGKVLRTAPHPNAEKLTVASVTDGKEEFQVVCGASNCRQGLVTAFAKVGAKIPLEEGKTLKIKKGKLRGEESFGMLCAADELQLAEGEQEGIMELDPETPLGIELATLHSDIVFEISLTPNLGHCASIIGIARELSAITGKPVKLPEATVTEDATHAIEDWVDIRVEHPEYCPRYTARILRELTVQPSPQWMQKRLLAAGMRPINNIVDVTNYVLLEQGHPLHAFDYDTLQGQQVVVKTAHANQHFVTLDEQEHVLNAHNLLVCDRERPVALAGLMGGLNSEVSEKTRTILLESAYFLPCNIRKSSKTLSISTEASKRFERGTDPHQTLRSLERATQLLIEVAGGSVVKGIVDVHENTFPARKLTCRLSRVNHVLGTALTSNEVETIFLRLGFSVEADGQDKLYVTVPTYRCDIKEEIDLVEEVARIYGYDHIAAPPPHYKRGSLPHAPIHILQKRIREILLGEGLQEIIACNLISPYYAQELNTHGHSADSLIHVMNPASSEQSILRPSLLPGFLQILRHNFDHRTFNFHGFEIGRVHFKERKHFKEDSVIGLVFTGKRRPHHWEVKPIETDFFDIKGSVENLCEALDLPGVHFQPVQHAFLHPGRQVDLVVENRTIGVIGEVHPATLRALDMEAKVYFAEIALTPLLELSRTNKKMKALPVFPSSERDWTVTIDKNGVPAEFLLQSIRSLPSKLLESVRLIDLYDDPREKNKRSITFRFVYRDAKKTISFHAVESEHLRITEEVLKTLEQTAKIEL